MGKLPQEVTVHKKQRQGWINAISHMGVV
jgi:hypothetical protein